MHEMSTIVAAAAAILANIDNFGVASVLFIIFGIPPMCLAWAMWRLSSVVSDMKVTVMDALNTHNTHYENNVELVNAFRKHDDVLIQNLTDSTEAMTRLSEQIKQIMRKVL